MKQGMKGEKFLLRHCWISVISIIRSWSLSIKSTKAVVLQGDIVKDDSGSSAVFTEQGKSTLRIIDGPLSFKECRIGDKSTKNTKVELYSEETL